MIIEEEIYLEHYGKQGMKWGKRSGTSSKPVGNRALNKASRDKDWSKQAKNVTKARELRKSGKLRSDWKQSKITYNRNKETMGSREARKILHKERTRINDLSNKSHEVKTRKGQIAAAAGLVTLGVLQIALANR